jgi:hypothetical protein
MLQVHLTFFDVLVWPDAPHRNYKAFRIVLFLWLFL